MGRRTSNLTAVEQRVLGALLEKSRVAPDTYPLTLPRLVAAVNQKTGRNPVTNHSVITVEGAVASLRGHGLVARAAGRGSTVTIEQTLDTVLDMDEAGRAILTVLLLRGPATPSDIRSWTKRLHPFADSADVEESLAHLAAADPPLVNRMRKESGQRAHRWNHVLCSMQDDDQRAVVPEMPGEEHRIPYRAPEPPVDAIPSPTDEQVQMYVAAQTASRVGPVHDDRPPKRMSRRRKVMISIAGGFIGLVALGAVVDSVDTTVESTAQAPPATTNAAPAETGAADDRPIAVEQHPTGSERARVINEARSLADDESYAMAIIAARPLVDRDRSAIRAYVVRQARRSVMVAISRRRPADARSTLNAAKSAGLTTDMVPAQRAYTTFVSTEKKRAAARRAAAEAEAARRAQEEADRRAREQATPQYVTPPSTENFDGLTCSDIRRQVIVPPGSHLDRDGDGIGCESYG